jgi:DNA-directed RNA polymerase specialized sigma24 family protein
MRHSPIETRDPLAHLDEPGAFQCLLLRALELPLPYRDVYLLKEVRGYSVAEIAARLELSVEAVSARLKRARREIASLEGSGHLGRSK